MSPTGVAVFSAKPYDRQYLDAATAGHSLRLTYFEAHLSRETAALAGGYGAVCVFVNDTLDRETLTRLAALGVRHVALRCAGFNNVDLDAARELGLAVTRVPAYSPHAVAEHTVALMLSLARKLNRASNRVRDGNFSLEGLLGFTFHGRTVGIVGAGAIGTEVARIMRGFGCTVLVADPKPDPRCLELGARAVPLDELLSCSDVVTLHCPLNEATRHLIDASALAKMRRGVMLLNTSRGAVVDTRALIDALKSGALGYLGLDVYEEEAAYFFEDRSDAVMQDDVLARLLTFPNVIVTSHQGFFTHEAMTEIAATTAAALRAAATSPPGTRSDRSP